MLCRWCSQLPRLELTCTTPLDSKTAPACLKKIGNFVWETLHVIIRVDIGYIHLSLGFP